jgi:hypothetical protein
MGRDGDGLWRRRANDERDSNDVDDALIAAANGASRGIAEPLLPDNQKGKTQAEEWRQFARKLRPALLLAAAWIVLCFIAVHLIDPYGVIGWPLIAGFNNVKPLQNLHARIYKPPAFVRNNDFLNRHYNGIVLGGSRELLGIDPANQRLQSAGYKFYNFGLVEERPYESAEITEFALGWAPIQTIILDLDFTRYNVEPLSIGDLRPFYPPDVSILRWALDQDLRAAVSVEGLQDSYNTVLASRHPNQQEDVYRFTSDGRAEAPGRRPSLDYNYERYFAGTFNRFLNEFLPNLATQSEQWMKSGFDHTPLHRIIESAATHNVRLVAFIPPDHALQMEALRRKGLWPAFERWKRDLVCVFHAAGQAHPGADMALWDFSGYNSITSQSLPRSGSPRRVMDYLDPVHYATSMGDRILATVLQLNDKERAAADFGVQLTVANIEQHLAQIRTDQAGYAAAHPDDLTWLAAIDRSAPQSPAALQAPQPEEQHCGLGQ